MSELFDHILDTLRANGWDAKDLHTLQVYSSEEPDTEVLKKSPRATREAWVRLYEAARRTAPVLKGEGLVDGALWDECGPDFVFCYAAGMRRLDEVGRDFGGRADPGDSLPPSDN